MNASITAQMINDEKILIKLSFSGKNCDQKNQVDAEAAKYMAEAMAIGMKYNGRFEAEVEATPENCQPFMDFAAKFKLEIIQL